MTQTNDEPRKTHASRRRKRRRSRASGILERLWSHWRVELIVILLMALAVFLLFERMQIRQTVLAWLRQGLQSVSTLGDSLYQGVASLIRRTTLSDLTAYIILLVVIVVALWRTRWRLMRLPRLAAQECPRCGSELHRIHRRFRDRLLGLFLPVRRYQCKNRDCRWHGLQTSRPRHK